MCPSNRKASSSAALAGRRSARSRAAQSAVGTGAIVYAAQRLRMVGSTVAALVAVSRKSTPSGGSSIIFSMALAEEPFRFCAP